jgi:hypothetical protein
MQMLYNSDSFAVVLFVVPNDLPGPNCRAVLDAAGGGMPADPAGSGVPGDAAGGGMPGDAVGGGVPGASALGRGGYEIVDKFAGKEIYLSGVLADHFKSGVDALIETSPSEEEMDAYLERFASLMQQAVVLH